jgi:hypothetical protein
VHADGFDARRRSAAASGGRRRRRDEPGFGRLPARPCASVVLPAGLSAGNVEAVPRVATVGSVSSVCSVVVVGRLVVYFENAASSIGAFSLISLNFWAVNAAQSDTVTSNGTFTPSTAR